MYFLKLSEPKVSETFFKIVVSRPSSNWYVRDIKGFSCFGKLFFFYQISRKCLGYFVCMLHNFFIHCCSGMEFSNCVKTWSYIKKKIKNFFVKSSENTALKCRKMNNFETLHLIPLSTVSKISEKFNLYLRTASPTDKNHSTLFLNLIRIIKKGTHILLKKIYRASLFILREFLKKILGTFQRLYLSERVHRYDLKNISLTFCGLIICKIYFLFLEINDRFETL